MDNPEAEIADVINMVAGATTPDSQIDAIEKYFTRDASFLHPLCYVAPGPNSRSRVTLIYLFYRALIPRTTLEVHSKAWDRQANRVFVALIQRPEIRGLSWFFVPDIPMRIHCTLRRSDGGKYHIQSQEDLIQPMSLLLTLPIIRWSASVFYWFCGIMGIMMAYVLMTLGFWRPIRHIRSNIDQWKRAK